MIFLSHADVAVDVKADVTGEKKRQHLVVYINITWRKQMRVHVCLCACVISEIKHSFSRYKLS